MEQEQIDEMEDQEIMAFEGISPRRQKWSARKQAEQHRKRAEHRKRAAFARRRRLSERQRGQQ